MLFNTTNVLLQTLFKAEEANLVKREERLIMKNLALGGLPDGFKYLGVIYSTLTGRNRQLGKYNTLSESLIPEMKLILEEKATIEYDKARIKMALSMSLKDAKTFQDIRDALPNGLVELVPECRRLERTRPEAYALLENERSYSQYMGLREKIDFYIASRLLY